jgi:uncharacterized protein YndB with AHSA1/START domain
VITHSIEINRSPEDVFAYLDQLERHGEWQGEIVSVTRQTDGPVRVGTRVREIRKMGRREIDASYEVTEHDPPHRTAFRGTVGPIRPVGTVTIEPAGDGSRARVSIDFNLLGFGFGKLIAPLARRDARKRIVGYQERLKEKLEAGA